MLRHSSLARYAVLMTVQHLVGAIERDWLRTTSDIRQLDNGFFCTDWWRGLDPKMSMRDFCSEWAFGSFFCSVVEGDEDATPPRPSTIEILLKRDVPVIFPP
jgi:hypothetical protein